MEKKKDGFKGQKVIVIPDNVLSGYCSINPLISGGYITDIGYYPKAKYHYRIRPEGIDQHILIYNTEGFGWAEVGDKKYYINPGDFFLVPAGESNRYAADEKNPWSIYWIHFKGSSADAFVKSFFEKSNSYAGKLPYNQQRVDLFDQLYKRLERGYSDDNLSYVNMILWHFLSSFLFHDVFNENTVGYHTDDPVNQSILYMQEKITSILSIQDLAAHVNISPSHYASIFKKKTGFSPIEYFNHLKAQRACQYLQFTSMRIKEIAYNLGMEDPYYFSRLFTKVMSISPKEYRNNFTIKQ
jgi:AraC-like DNA-binding protein